MEPLFAQFPGRQLSEWKAKLEKDLKGQGFDDLTSMNRSGLAVAPFYNKENGGTGVGGGLFAHTDWNICSEITVAHEADANKVALYALSRGASELAFVIPDGGQIDLHQLLEGIEIPYITTRFRIIQQGEAFIAILDRYLKRLSQAPDPTQLYVAVDPIADGIAAGASLPAAARDEWRLLLSDTARAVVCVDGSLYHNAGAHPVYELACLLAHLNEYAHDLSAAGMIDKIMTVHFEVAVGTQFFEEIAKLRALRKLLPLLGEVYQQTVRPILHIRSSDVYRTPVDIYNNLLRDTISGLAGVLGGADSLCLHTFDLYHPIDDARAGQRLAINQQLIFKEESYLDKIADAGAGSFYLERLTDEMAAAAWATFQKMEQHGGLIKYFHDGRLYSAITDQANALVASYQSGERTLIGVNRFVNENDPPRDFSIPKAPDGALQPLNLAAALVKS